MSRCKWCNKGQKPERLGKGKPVHPYGFFEPCKNYRKVRNKDIYEWIEDKPPSKP